MEMVVTMANVMQCSNNDTLSSSIPFYILRQFFQYVALFMIYNRELSAKLDATECNMHYTLIQWRNELNAKDSHSRTKRTQFHNLLDLLDIPFHCAHLLQKQIKN